MPQTMGMIARPRNRKPVRVNIFFPTAASFVEKVRIATDCQTVMSAIQRRTCHRMKPRPRSSIGFHPRPPMWPSTAPTIPLQPTCRRQARVTITVPAARKTYCT